MYNQEKRREEKLRFSLTYPRVLRHNICTIFLTEHLIGGHVFLLWLDRRKKETKILNYKETYSTLLIFDIYQRLKERHCD